MKLKSQEELTRGWPAKWTAPTVLVRCTVFNHGQFIERCLQGFLIQETTFPFEVFVHDDASTDESANIIRQYVERYPLILKPVYERENQYSKKDGSFFRTTWEPVLRGGHKYIAMCEGDDYWTDPKKLQKQVEYMEGHPGCAGCFHERGKCDEEGRIMEGSGLPDEMKRSLSWEDLEEGMLLWRIPCPPTCTVMYRKEVLLSRPAWMDKQFSGDKCTCLWCAYAHGSIDWVGDIKASVYRIHGGGVWTHLSRVGRLERQQGYSRCMMEHFPINRYVRRRLGQAWARENYRLRRELGGACAKEEHRRWRELHRAAKRSCGIGYMWSFAQNIWAFHRDKARESFERGMKKVLQWVLPQKQFQRARMAWRAWKARNP